MSRDDRDATGAPINYTARLCSADSAFAYHVADIKGGDVDKPHNLAKSVKVE